MGGKVFALEGDGYDIDRRGSIKTDEKGKERVEMARGGAPDLTRGTESMTEERR